ncbi:tyrosine-type recombinase/integrase [Polaribacter sp.]|uniref:tyrosine-type recombinase/integrase n=1 Tax=Polaribacter sp. TaxID=1920175 RepID=UPI003F6C4877
MQSIQELITFTTKIEHDLEHDLKVLPLFSSPKIYTAKGDLSKRWYVYFSFRNPETGKLIRMANIYGKVNQYKTKEARMSVLSSYRKNLIILLRKGYNPFTDNNELYTKLKNSNKEKEIENEVEEKAISSSLNNAIQSAIQEAISQKGIANPVQYKSDKGKTASNTKENAKKVKTKTIEKSIAKQVEKTKVYEEQGLSIEKAFNFALDLKEKEVSERTIRDYRRKIKLFIIWMEEKYPNIKFIKQISRKNLIEYLNSILLKTSARNRNNFRTELGSVFQVLKNNELITENYIQSIPVLKSKPERNKTYTLKIQESIFSYLEKEDPHLLLFIKFVSYSFIRPIEVCRLKVKDININTKTVQFKAKNSPLKIKIIPNILFDELPDLSKLDKESLLFTPNIIGGFWNANETNRRDHFSKRFRKVVKNHFKLNEDYGIYSFRHTFISRLYRKLRENSAPFEAKSNLMLITGHTSMSALEKYLREIDAELPEDYSKLFR